MATVEAAASLFGSDSPDGDLFADLGTDAQPEVPATPKDGPAKVAPPTTSNALTFTSAGATYPETNDLFTIQDTAKYPDFTTTLYDTPVAQHAPETSPYTSTTGQPPAQTYHNAYEPQANPYATPGPAVSPPAPASNVPVVPTYPSYTPNAYTPSTTSYSPYALSNSLGTQSAYPSYPTASTATNYAPPPPPRAVSPPVQAPPPPPPVSALVRPKVVNAYDPPFIPRTPKRGTRTVAGTQNAYQVPQASQSAVLPQVPGSVYSNPPVFAPHPPPPVPRLGAHDTYNPQSTPYVSTAPPLQTSPPAPMLQTQQHQVSPYTRVQPQTQGVPSSYASHPAPNTVSSQSNVASTSVSQVIGNVDLGEEQDIPPVSSTFPPDSRPYDDLLPSHKTPFLGPTASPPSRPPSASPPPAAHHTNGSAKHSPPSRVLKSGVSGRASPDASLSGTAHEAHSSQKDRSPKESHDPYAPKLPHSYTNYIPRTSSPLSFPPDRPKPQVGNGTANAYSPPQSMYTVPYAPAAIPRPPSAAANEVSKPRTLSLSAEPTGRLQNSQYAPSPSLLGSNDPLARTSARAPIVSFGFAGKLVTCFHGMPGLNAGFDVAISSRTSSELKMRVVQKILPEAVSILPSPGYPGPLISDPGTPALSIVRPGTASQTKSKKAAVISYLAGRVEEIRQSVAYLNSEERRAAEGKLILVNLLKLMVENDGRLLGNASDQAVRIALVPRLETPLTATDGFLPGRGFRTVGQSGEVPLSTTSTKASTLDVIEDLLLRGERHKASQYAMDEKLWAHAMIIASSIDKDAWKGVVNDFLRSELPTPAAGSQGEATRGRESLRVAYSLFSGQGAAAVQELAPVSLLQRATLNIPPPAASVSTPRTSHFPSQQQPVPPESLSRWAETATMMISSPTTMDTSAALTALGDQLLASNWVEAAHVCYLLSPQTSPLGGFGGPATRISLLGCKAQSEVWKDPDYITLSEILEFALSLAPVAKGQEPFHCLPHLQPYRLARAVTFAEAGNTSLATRYCEAVTSTLTQGSPYTTQTLVEQLHGLTERLTGVHSDKSSWIGGKISKPSLDTIGGWLEGRFTKLVTGDSDTPTPIAEEKKVNDSAFTGPFAHYSTISSATPSARSSPQPPFSNPHAVTALPARTSSAIGFTHHYTPTPIERASSASGYSRPHPNVYTSGSSSVTSSQSSPTTSFAENPLPSNEGHGTRSPLIEQVETPVQNQTSGWWDSLGSATKTPTAATFYQVEEPTLPSSSGFVSLMDSQPLTIGQTLSERTSSGPKDILEDDEGLGLGNPKPKPKDESPAEATESSKPQAVPEKKPEQDAPPKSWFSLSRLWNRSGDAPTTGPVKASLGQESSFYYDKDLKRWVNKNASPEDNVRTAVPPPPPSRAQTASPGMAGSGNRPPPPSSATPPPPRAASAIDLTTEPPTQLPPAPRIRSNLAPAEADGPPLPPTSRQQSPAPPPSRPRSQATKRNVRSRYVDVFQQGGNASS